MQPLSHSHPLRKMFAGLTEHAFISEMGVTDTRLIDYLTAMLTRFIHRDAIFAIRGNTGRPLSELAEMLLEAERDDRKGDPRRELFRHIGDFALFWTGVYPEALETRSARVSPDILLSYSEQGKRCYFIASTYHDTPSQAEEAPVLRRLSEEFELCALGLRKVRSYWERHEC